MSTSAAYSGLESSPPSSKTRRSSALRSASSSSSASGRRSAAGAAADSSNDDDEGWHHINTGAAHDAPPMKSKTNKMRNANSASSFQIGHDDDNDDDEESDDNDNNDEYDDDDDDDEDDDYTPTLNQHLSGRTTLLRPRSTCRCSLLLQTFLAVGAIFAVIAMIRNGPTMKNNLRRHPNNNPNKSGEMITVVAHAAYEPMHSSRLEEYDAKLTLYRHLATGAEFLAYIPDSKEGTLAGGKSGKSKGKAGGGSDEGGGYDPKPDKVFGVAFRTKPESNTGVPHILEHSVLCGSKKYPSRDPFAHLLKGSLQTFLNAMTYPDRTVYPVASRNKADFRNLMDVYLDAVFHPRAVTKEGWWVLRQEGWRYDVVDDGSSEGDNDDEEGGGGGERRSLAQDDRSIANNNKSQQRVEFEYKGVVYSEMKGAYSDPEDLLGRITQSLLFPDNPYFYDSGGDPAVIPTLTREEFVAFYKKYYHPTNARIFVAGDESDVYHALSTVDKYISPMGYNPDSRKDSVINYQPRKFEEPVRERKPFAAAATDSGGEDADEEREGHMLCVTWLLNTEPFSQMMELAWIVLDSLLLGKPSSPLRKALEDSGFGEETIGGGLDDSLLQATFAIGMKGIKRQDDLVALEELIMNTLTKITSDGFNDDEIASTMNTIEFMLREGGGGLRGMEIFLGSLTKWNYDLSPKDALVYEERLKLMKEAIENEGSGIFQRMIQDSLLGNNHRVVLELFPSTTLESEQKQAAKNQISRAQSSMSDEEYKQVLDDGMRLKQLQDTDETPEVLATNPALSISDIDPIPIEYPIHVHENAFESGIRVISHEVASSGIAYVDLGLDISMVPFEDTIFLPSLITLLNEAGTSDQSDAEFRNYIGKVTGGVYASLEMMSVKPTGWDDDSKILPGVNMLTILFIRGKCTIDKISDLFDVFEKVLTEINFKDSKSILQNSLKSSLSAKKSDIASRGHSFANRRIRGRYSVRSFIDEKMYGVSSVDSYELILKSIESDWGKFVGRLTKVMKAILNGNRSGMLLNLTGDRTVLDAVMEKAENFLLNGIPPPDAGKSPPPTPDFRSVDHPWIADAREKQKISNPIRDEGIAVSTQVAYTAEGGRIYDVGDTVSGSVSVVSHYLTTGYMWDVIRAKNGAYGAYSQFSSTDGVLTLYTYRDPNPPDSTLAAFAAASNEIIQDAATSILTRDDNAAITTAIIGTIGGLDGSALSAQGAGWEALLRYLEGDSALSRQRWRKEVLETSVDDFVNFGGRMQLWLSPSIAVVASKSALEEMKGDLFVINPQ